MTKGDPFNRIPEERSANTNFTRKRERRGGRNENGRRKERRFKKSRRFSVYPVNSLFPLFENCFRQPFRKLVNKDKNLGTFGEMVANRKNSWKLVSWVWMEVRCYSKVYKKKKKAREVIVSLLVATLTNERWIWWRLWWHLDRFRRSKVFHRSRKIFSSKFELEWDRWRCDIKIDVILVYIYIDSYHCIFCFKLIFLLLFVYLELMMTFG